jgi:hypothetical protein
MNIGQALFSIQRIQPTVFGFEVTTTGASESYSLYIDPGTTGLNIDWGDGNDNAYTGGGQTVSHTFATAGVRDVKLSGTLTTFRIDVGNGKNQITDILGLGTDVTELTSMYASFKNWQGNSSIPIIIPDSVYQINLGFEDSTVNQEIIIGSGVRVMNSMLDGATLYNKPLTIPNTVTIQSAVLKGARSFNSKLILSDNAPNCYRILYRAYAFNQDISFPPGMSGGSSAMYQCTSFDSIATLGAGTTDLGATFHGCTAMTTRPIISHLDGFLSDGYHTFYNCTAITGESEPIWDWNTIPSSHAGFYYNCTSLSDYATIPAGYK